MGRRDREAVGGLRIDPELREFVENGATNLAALSEKEQRDRKRVCLRVDLPGSWLKELLARAAAEEDVSLSHMAAFLIGWALVERERGNPELAAAMEENRGVYRSLNAGHRLDVEWVKGCLTDSAEGAEEGQGGV